MRPAQLRGTTWSREALPTTPNPISGKVSIPKDGEAHLRACLAEMKRLNVVKGVVSGGSGDRLAAAARWREAAPDRIIAGAGVRGSEDTPLPELGLLRKEFAAGRLRVLGEVTAQYAGLSLSDPKYERPRRHRLAAPQGPSSTRTWRR